MVPPLCGLPAAVVVGAASGLTPIEREYDHWHSPQQKTAARLPLTLGGEGTWRLCETHHSSRRVYRGWLSIQLSL